MTREHDSNDKKSIDPADIIKNVLESAWKFWNERGEIKLSQLSEKTGYNFKTVQKYINIIKYVTDFFQEVQAFIVINDQKRPLKIAFKKKTKEERFERDRLD